MPTTNVFETTGVNTADWYNDLSSIIIGDLASTIFPTSQIVLTFTTGRSVTLEGSFIGDDITNAAGDITGISLDDSRGSVAFVSDFNDTLENFRLAIINAALAGDPQIVVDFFANREWTFSGGEGNDSTVSGASADVLVGNGGEDTLAGGDSFDRLIGGSGAIVDDFLIDDGVADLLIGGKDNDLYFVGTGDVVNELSGDIEGTSDEMRSSIDMTIAANVEILRLVGTSGLTAYGNTARNILHGNTGDNQLFGYAGNDDLFGGDGDDRLGGGADVDSMVGGHGNDTYEVDNTLDKVVESPGQGLDVIISTATFTMTANTEKLWLTGSADLDGTGKNDSVNGDEISGNAGDNLLKGFAGADKLIGNGGDDTLDGGIGADTMEGGAGGDIYYVDNSGDAVNETLSGATGGEDWVISSVSYTLGANLEDLYLRDAVAAIRATGNTAANYVVGNKYANEVFGLGGADNVDGLAGADTLYGGDGNDTYVVDNASDRVIETSSSLSVGGNDTVHAKISYTLVNNVENLLLLITAANGTGNALANTITGNAANNSLYGLDGLDTIKGMAGADTIVGGHGGDDLYAGVDTVRDVFQFQTYQDSAAASSNLNLLDWIFEFKRGSDKIDLSLLDADANVRNNQAYKLDANGDFKAGEIKLVKSGTHTIVLLNSDADSSSELAFMVRNVSTLSASDFIL